MIESRSAALRRRLLPLLLLPLASCGSPRAPEAGPSTAGAAAPSASAAEAASPSATGSQELDPLSPEAALKTFKLQPGYHIELVASEPLVQDPVAINFDGDGRLWVVEMRGYMPNLEGTGEDRPVGRVVVLEDTDNDGKMDRRTVYMDSLVMPRALSVMEHGVLVAATPNLWFTRDTNGDLKADTKELLTDQYGNLESNPEHNANGLLWGMDNWIHNAGENYPYELHLTDGHFETRSTGESLGQWGVSSDDYGRLYRNSNSSPLHVDLLSAHYLGRNPDLQNGHGVYVDVTGNVAVWPAHPTPAVNRGYMNGVLRPDSTLAKFTAAGAATVYVGDRLPHELYGDVFVAEPSANLVHRFDVSTNADGTLSATNPYDQSEFLSSTDTYFRPVNLASAPDGTLYVVDLYHGIIQHRAYITPYLAGEITAKGLQVTPFGMGRIYRIVHDGTQRDQKPQMLEQTSADLVQYLAHPNGWWRQTAERLIVERGDTSVAPAVRELALNAPDDRTRLRALWTLDGLGAADATTIRQALTDTSGFVRAAAIRIAEPYLASGDQPLTTAVMGLLDDAAPQVHWQLAASLGELPENARVPQLAKVLQRYGDDPIALDAAVSGLQDQEVAMIESLLSGGQPSSAVIERLAATATNGGETADIQRLVALSVDDSHPEAERLAILTGMHNGAAPGRRRQEGPPNPTIHLPSAPQTLIALADGSNDVSAQADTVLALMTWPGKPMPKAPPPTPLTPEEQARFAAGKTQFLATCAVCHQASGLGAPGVAADLVGSRWVQARPEQVIRIVLQGKDDGDMLMPPIGATLTDEQVAAVLTYVRNEWGNHASPITPEKVKQVRASTANRRRPWNDSELRQIAP